MSDEKNQDQDGAPVMGIMDGKRDAFIAKATAAGIDLDYAEGLWAELPPHVSAQVATGEAGFKRVSKDGWAVELRSPRQQEAEEVFGTMAGMFGPMMESIATSRRAAVPKIEADESSPWKITHNGETEQTAIMAIPGGWLVRLRCDGRDTITRVDGFSVNSQTPEGWPAALPYRKRRQKRPRAKAPTPPSRNTNAVAEQYLSTIEQRSE
jgi:hypothetical protein